MRGILAHTGDRVARKVFKIRGNPLGISGGVV
jgi:hypothetical protein